MFVAESVDVSSAATRCSGLAEAVRGLEAEKAAMSILHEQEAEKLRAAHSRSLEMLMEFQEENDLLRSTVTIYINIYISIG